MIFLHEKNWSPYVSGIIIGLLQIPLVLLLNKTLGASSSLSEIACQCHSLLSKDNFYVAINSHLWQVGLVFGILLGAFLSTKLSQIKRPAIATIWGQDFNIRSKITRYSLSFVGGILLILGARFANGCTSGNGISGTAQLDASAWVMLPAMFMAGIITTYLLRSITRKGE